MLQERGYYQIVLSDNTVIPIRFSTWTLKRFCELRGNLTLNQLFDVLGAGGATLGDFVLLVLCAAECLCKEKKEPFNYTDFEACNWIDEMGGMGGEKFNEMVQVIAQSTKGEESKKNLTAV